MLSGMLFYGTNESPSSCIFCHVSSPCGKIVLYSLVDGGGHVTLFMSFSKNTIYIKYLLVLLDIFI